MPDPTYASFNEAFTEYRTNQTVTVFPDIQASTAQLDLVVFFGYSEDGFWALADAVYYLLEGFNYHAAYGIIDEDYGAHDGSLWWAAQGGGTVSLQTVNEAMKEGAYLEISDFLSILWAFQQIMWDQPFFPEKYATLINEIRT